LIEGLARRPAHALAWQVSPVGPEGGESLEAFVLRIDEPAMPPPWGAAGSYSPSKTFN